MANPATTGRPRNEPWAKLAAGDRTALEQALQLCARRDGFNANELCLLSVESSGAKTRALVGTSQSSAPAYVIKMSRGKWNAEREFQGLEFLKTILPSERAAGRFRLGAIEPVGFSSEPPILVTRYQPGTCMRSAFEKGILGFRSAKALAEAKDYSRALAVWLHHFRTSRVEEGTGFAPAEFLASCQEVQKDIRNSRARQCAERTMACMKAYVAALEQPEVALLRDSHPVHGDFAPQNFVVGREGTLYGLDIGRFGFHSVDIDLASFRMRLEHYLLRNPFMRRRVQAIWREFWDAYSALGASATFGLLSYLYRMLRILAEARIAPSFRTRLRDRLWLISRLDWCRRLEGDLRVDSARFRDRL